MIILFRMLAATIAVVCMAFAASAEVRVYPAPESAGQTSAILAEHKAGGGGKGLGGGLKGLGGGLKGLGHGLKGLGGGAFKGLGGGGSRALRGGHGLRGHGGHGGGTGHRIGQHEGSRHASRGGATPGRGRPASLHEETYNGHQLSHLTLGANHRMLVDHNFKKPGGHLNARLARLHNYRWHSDYKHVVIVGAIGGGVLCELYCEFDVPDDVYGDFVAAVDEAQAPDVEASEYKEDDASLADVPVEEQPARRVEQEHGWNKAVAILEEARAQEDSQLAEAQKDGKEVEAVVDQPDEQVDVVVDEQPVDVVVDEEKKG